MNITSVNHNHTGVGAPSSVCVFRRIGRQQYMVHHSGALLGCVWKNIAGKWSYGRGTDLARGVEVTRADAAEMLVYHYGKDVLASIAKATGA